MMRTRTTLGTSSTSGQRCSSAPNCTPNNTANNKCHAARQQQIKEVDELISVLLAGGSPGGVCPLCSLVVQEADKLQQHLQEQHGELLSFAVLGVSHLVNQRPGRCLICIAAHAKEGTSSTASKAPSPSGRQHVLLAHLPECLALATTIADICAAAPAQSHAPRAFACPASTLCQRKLVPIGKPLPRLNACRAEPMPWNLLANHLLQQHFMKLLSSSILRAQGREQPAEPVVPTSKSARRAATPPSSKPSSRPSSTSGAKPWPPSSAKPLPSPTGKSVIASKWTPAATMNRAAAPIKTVQGKGSSSKGQAQRHSSTGSSLGDDLMNELFEAAIAQATLDRLLPSDQEAEEWLLQAEAAMYGMQLHQHSLACNTGSSDCCVSPASYAEEGCASAVLPSSGWRLNTQPSLGYLSMPLSSPASPTSGYPGTQLPTDEEVEQWFTLHKDPFATDKLMLLRPDQPVLDCDTVKWHSTLQVSPHSVLMASETLIGTVPMSPAATDEAPLLEFDPAAPVAHLVAQVTLTQPGNKGGIYTGHQGLTEEMLDPVLSAAASLAFPRAPPVSGAGGAVNSSTPSPGVDSRAWRSSAGGVPAKPHTEMIGAFTTSTQLMLMAAEDTNNMAAAVLAASAALDHKIKPRSKGTPRVEAVQPPSASIQ